MMYRINYGNGQVSRTARNVDELLCEWGFLDGPIHGCFVQFRDNGEWFKHFALTDALVTFGPSQVANKIFLGWRPTP